MELFRASKLSSSALIFCLPLVVSQTRRVPSLEPVASRVPSWFQADEITSGTRPFRVCNVSPLSPYLHSLTIYITSLSSYQIVLL